VKNVEKHLLKRERLMITWNVTILMKEIMSVISKAVAKRLKLKWISITIRKVMVMINHIHVLIVKKTNKNFGWLQAHVFKKHPEVYKAENVPKVDE